jgi:hypothetical protein
VTIVFSGMVYCKLLEYNDRLVMLILRSVPENGYVTVNEQVLVGKMVHNIATNYNNVLMTFEMEDHSVQANICNNIINIVKWYKIVFNVRVVSKRGNQRWSDELRWLLNEWTGNNLLFQGPSPIYQSHSV